MNIVSAIISQPLPLRVLCVFVIAAIAATQVNRAIYGLVADRWDKPRIGPWSKRDASLPPRSWFDYLPILGWYTLRRESKVHGSGYWIRPLLIELGLAIFLAWLYQFEVQGGLLPRIAGVGPEMADFQEHAHCAFLIHTLLILLLTVATFIDFDFRIIPDEVTIPGTVLGILICTLLPKGALPILVPLSLFSPSDQLEFLRFTSYADGTPWPDWLDSWIGLAMAVAIVSLWAFCLFNWYLNLRTARRRGVGVMLKRFFQVLIRTASPQYFNPLWPSVLVAWLVSVSIFVIAWMLGGEIWQSSLSSAIGLAAGGGIVLGIRIIGSSALGQDAMGFGDVTMMAMVGAFLGYQPAAIAFFCAPFAAIFIVIVVFLIPKKKPPKTKKSKQAKKKPEEYEVGFSPSAIPFGPYLALGSVFCVLWWATIWHGHARNAFALGWLLPAIVISMLPIMWIMLWGMRLLRGEPADEEES